jgi:uncharacterized FlaG/YvyC family protein
VFHQLDPRENRMPADTSRTVKARPMRQPTLVNPDLFVQNNPAFQRLFADLNPANPARVRQMTKEQLQQMVADTNRKIAGSVQFKGIRFDLHEESGRMFAVIKDRRSGEVLKQFPSDYLLEMSSRIQKAAGSRTDIQA